MNSESVKKVTNQAIEQLVEALNAGHSEALTRYLAAMAKFRAYSFLNVLLILKQCPNASRVAGYRTWQSFGRQVKQGAKGIMILAPMFRKGTETTDESSTTEESRRVAGFRAVYVWDEQQTTGKELPRIGSVTGDPSFYVERLEEFVRASGIRLDYSADIAPARGMAEKGKITLLPEQTPAETFATLVHELAHSDMHFGERRADTNSLAGAVGIFFALYLFARWATRTDPQILRFLLNSRKIRTQYDPTKFEPVQVRRLGRV